MPKCYACGANETKLWLDRFEHHYLSDGVDQVWPYSLMECESCGLGFIDPMPDWTLLRTFYSNSYHCYSHDPNYDQIDEQSKYEIARLRLSGLVSGGRSRTSPLKRFTATAVEWVSGKTVTYSLGIPLQLSLNAMIFEIGYGTGQWLYNMASLGYEHLYGYDIDVNPASRTTLESMGIRLSTGVFEENPYPSGAFDCIRLEHVFEHLLDPKPVLGKCQDMLKPGGSLVMTLPCKDSLSRGMSSRHWGPLEPPVHLFHHTSRSTKLLLEEAGFRVIKIKPYCVADQITRTIINIASARGFHLPASVGWLFRLMAPAYRAVGAVTGKGDFMTVWAKAAE